MVAFLAPGQLGNELCYRESAVRLLTGKLEPFGSSSTSVLLLEEGTRVVMAPRFQAGTSLGFSRAKEVRLKRK